ncbi:Tat pathway signal protein [Lewinellaceae bacterium SD302]|nr:Tat pathway signal protein [Lewinellaceae bacterium SD302]
MDRRESLKNLLIGAAATGALFKATGCEDPAVISGDQPDTALKSYAFEGTRTDWEKQRDARMHAVDFFNDGERKTLDVLADLILPEDEGGPAASTTGTTEFIEFMANDYPAFQLPLRGGLSWLSGESLDRFGNNDFTQLTAPQQTAILDDIAYLPDDKEEILSAPVAFFDLLRKLVQTGYFTSKEGIKDLGYQGNQPNLWDGVPEEVLAKHDVDYDPEWLAKCIDHETRDEVARWDDNMNLLN